MPDAAVASRRVPGAARFIRGWVTAVIAVLLAAAGHQAAHSVLHGATEPLAWPLLVFAVALTAPVAVCCAARRRAVWSTAVTTLAGQLIFHLLYSLPATPTAVSHHHSPGPMVAAHVLAALATTLVVCYGEHSLITLLHWFALTPARRLLTARQAVTQPPPRVLAHSTPWIPHPMNVAQSRGARGPPVLA